MGAVTRRPWLVVVVLVLLGISLTTLVKSGRTTIVGGASYAW